MAPHLLKLSILILIPSAIGISFREQPESRTAIAGNTVILHCSVNNQADIHLYWQNLDSSSYISLNRRMNPYGQLNRDQERRFEIVGNSERGEYYLQISNISKADEGRYACVFFLNFNYYSQVAKLMVVRPPDRGYPKCTIEPLIRPAVGDNITLVCESRGGDPPATLSWVRGTTRLAMKRGRHSKGDPVIKYPITLTEDDSDVRFTCVANNQALQQPRTCSLTPLRSSLGVLLRPVVASVEVGDSFTFVCITERMPNLVYQWYINENPIDGRESRFTYIRGGQQFRIEAVTMEDDYALVKCEVTQKDYSYTGSAVGLLWVQNTVSTPDITETEMPTTPAPNRITTRLTTTLRALSTRTTTSMATTAGTTTAATPTTDATTTTKVPVKTTVYTTTSATVTDSESPALIPVVLNNPSVPDSEQSESMLSSSYSSVSSLSSETHETVPSESDSQLDTNLQNEEESTPSNTDFTPTPEAETNTETPDNDIADTGSNSASIATNANIVVDPAVNEHTTTAAVSGTDNEIDQDFITPNTTGAPDDSDNIADIGSGNDADNDIGGLSIFSDTGPKLPNEAGLGYNSDRVRGMPNWGLIAGLFVVFIIIVAALTGLAVYLYRRKRKEPKGKAAT